MCVDLKTFLIRISICLLLSIIIGIERQYRHGAVGLRTNVLVGLGAFMFNYATYGFVEHDQSRIAAAIVSGIGFLGAGMIIKDGRNIQGLNTAATLWCVAAIGILTSIGMTWEAVIGTVLVIVSNVILRLLSLFIMDKIKETEKCVIKITCFKDIEIVIRSAFSKYIEKNQLKLAKLEKKLTKEGINLTATIITSRIEKIESLVKNLSAEPEVTAISWEHNKYYVSDNADGSLDD